MAAKRSRLWMGLGIGLVIAAGLTAAFWPRPTAVDTGVAGRGPMIATVEEEARTRVAETYVVTAPITGRLLRIELEPGDRVAAGQAVARMLAPAPPALDSRARAQAAAAVETAQAALANARASRESARTALGLAESEAARIEPLAGTGAVAEADIDRARAERARARSALASAEALTEQQEAELTRARAALIGAGASGGEAVSVTAPVTGQVLRVVQESATTLAAGQPILEIGDVTGGLEVVAELISAQALEVSPGDRVILDIPGAGRALEGVVARIDPSGFTKISALGVEEQRVNVVIAFSGPADGIGDGYRLNARIVVWEDENALTVPSSALFRHQEGWAVFRVASGRARLTPVQAGRNNGIEAQILDGLEPDAEVVLFPGPDLAGGMRVRRRE